MDTVLRAVANPCVSAGAYWFWLIAGCAAISWAVFGAQGLGLLPRVRSFAPVIAVVVILGLMALVYRTPVVVDQMTWDKPGLADCCPHLEQRAVEVMGPWISALWIASLLVGNLQGNVAGIAVANLVLWVLHYHGAKWLAYPLLWLSGSSESVAAVADALEVFFGSLDYVGTLVVNAAPLCIVWLRSVWGGLCELR